MAPMPSYDNDRAMKKLLKKKMLMLISWEANPQKINNLLEGILRKKAKS